MSVDINTVDKIAKLANLEFDEEGKENIKVDLNKMLNMVDKLEEIDTENVEPLVYMLDEKVLLREDKAETTTTQKEALKNAPDKDTDYFKVPKVLKK